MNLYPIGFWLIVYNRKQVWIWPWIMGVICEIQTTFRVRGKSIQENPIFNFSSWQNRVNPRESSRIWKGTVGLLTWYCDSTVTYAIHSIFKLYNPRYLHHIRLWNIETLLWNTAIYCYIAVQICMYLWTGEHSYTMVK